MVGPLKARRGREVEERGRSQLVDAEAASSGGAKSEFTLPSTPLAACRRAHDAPRSTPSLRKCSGGGAGAGAGAGAGRPTPSPVNEAFRQLRLLIMASLVRSSLSLYLLTAAPLQSIPIGFNTPPPPPFPLRSECWCIIRVFRTS